MWVLPKEMISRTVRNDKKQNDNLVLNFTVRDCYFKMLLNNWSNPKGIHNSRPLCAVVQPIKNCESLGCY